MSLRADRGTPAWVKTSFDLPPGAPASLKVAMDQASFGPPSLNDQFALLGFQCHAGQLSAITAEGAAGFAADFRRCAGECRVFARIHQHFKDHARPGIEGYCLLDILSHLFTPRLRLPDLLKMTLQLDGNPLRCKRGLANLTGAAAAAG
jgi:hypothetical protein